MSDYRIEAATREEWAQRAILADKEASRPGRTRTIIVVGNIAYVPLTRGYVAVIDATDVDRLSNGSWQATAPSRSGVVYAVQNLGRRQKRSRRIMHRVLMGDSDMMVDHIDGNGLNNRRSNLRWATASQNVINQKRRSDNLSGFKCVCFSALHKKWRARIKANGKRLHLGYFETPEKAFDAYKAASEKLHGEFARHE
jgi:hypothetical protein